MSRPVETLFDEFAARYARGERPDARLYLEEAGQAREELGALIDAYVESAPVQPPDEETLILMRSRLEGQPALLVLRNARGVSRERIVDAIVSAFGIAEAKRLRVADYYHRLEVGLLDVGGVSRKVLDVIESLLGADPARYAGPAAHPATGGVFFRAETGEMGAPPPPAAPARVVEAGEPDDVDRLFAGGSG